MSDSQFKKFLKQHWPLPPVRDQPTEEQIIALERQIWYCNCSKQFIPELQQYNKQPISFGYNSNRPVGKYYRAGYTNFRVYKNGQAFLDIHILSMLFDYYHFYSCIKKEEIQNQINRLSEINPFEVITSRGHGNIQVQVNPQSYAKLPMYKIVRRYACATVPVRDYIPKEMLRFISSDFVDGDVIDTNGYKGGIYIKSKEGFIDNKEQSKLTGNFVDEHKTYKDYFKFYNKDNYSIVGS